MEATTETNTRPTANKNKWWDSYAVELLPFVEKPSRYINHEVNSRHTSWDDVRLHIALAFPDVYEIGISHLGLHILYHILNERDDTVAERCYAPWPDAEKILKEKNIPLCTLESCRSLTDCDILGFSIQYELCYTNILSMLDTAGIPLRTEERLTGSFPLVIAGGNVYSPGPLSPFIDAFVVGDGEETIVRIADWATERIEEKNTLAPTPETLAHLVETVPGIFAPSLYPSRTADDIPGRECPSPPSSTSIPWPVEKQYVKNISSVPTADSVIVPLCEGVHDRAQIEIARGCVSGCRFCQAGMITRPLREKTPEKIIDEAQCLIHNTGYEDITLSSLSAGDYTYMNDVLRALLIERPDDMPPVSVSLPSMRMDSFSPDIAEALKKIRRTGFTFAPEAGTDRLRKVINKNITDEDILRTVTYAAEAGWQMMKLYFMIGLPTETMEDVEGIVTTVKDILDVTQSVTKKGVQLRVSIANFIPKPMTPFQWEKYEETASLKEKQEYLLHAIPRRVKISMHSLKLSKLEAIFARGDSALADVVEVAYKNGCRFDQWNDKVNYDAWEAAFAACNKNMEEYCAAIPSDTALPWDVVDSGVTRAFLLKEKERAYNEESTESCRSGKCHNCGVQRWGSCQNDNQV